MLCGTNHRQRRSSSEKASPAEEREKYEINPSPTMIVWDPDKCAINDEVRIADYLGPRNDT